MPMKAKLLLIFMLVPALMRAQEVGVVCVSAANLHLNPDYESPLETQEIMGVPLAICDTSRYWVNVITPQPYQAWITDKNMVRLSADEFEAYQAAPKYIVTAVESVVYSQPSCTSAPVSDLVCGCILRKEFKGLKPLVKKGFRAVVLPDGRKGWVPLGHLEDIDAWQRRVQSLNAEDIVELAISHAMKMLGRPYVWGGNSSRGFDCSGLVRNCFLMTGKALPRNASQQFAYGKEIPVQRLADGSFNLSSLQRGDLVFFGRMDPEKGARISHVGIYLGGNRFIHSSQLVRVNSLSPSDEDCYENYWRLVKACRIVE